MTGFDLELGPSGGIQDGSWTCPLCGDTLDTVSFVAAAMHEVYHCPKSPHQDQSRLESYEAE